MDPDETPAAVALCEARAALAVPSMVTPGGYRAIGARLREHQDDPEVSAFIQRLKAGQS